MNFSETLRTKTHTSHKKAEGCDLMKSFMDLTIADNPYHYYIYLEAFGKIYTTLENKLSSMPFYFPQLNRAEALERDLIYFKKFILSIDRPEITLNALTRYVTHIEEADELTLIAHSYVRYLGDLSGGFIIQKRIKAAFNLTDQGFDFYVFNISDPIAFKNMYKLKLNDMNLDLNKFIDVCNDVFELNYSLFVEISQL